MSGAQQDGGPQEIRQPSMERGRERERRDGGKGEEGWRDRRGSRGRRKREERKRQ